MSDRFDTDEAADHQGRRIPKSLRDKAPRLTIVVVLVVTGAWLSWFEPQSILLMREWIWDEMVRSKPREYDPGLKVRIVDIDEASLAAHGVSVRSGRGISAGVSIRPGRF